MPYLAAVIMLGVYAYNLPLMLAFIWKENGHGFGVGALECGYALKNARSRMGRRDNKKTGKRRKNMRAGHISKLAGHIRIEYFSVRMVIGTDDAAATALLCGSARSLAGAIAGAAGRSKVDIRPDFERRGISGEAGIVFSVKLGQLVMNAVYGLIKHG